MFHLRVAVYLLAIVPFAAVDLSAQEPTCSHRVLPVTIFSSQGRILRGLSPADFEARIHGRPVKIVSIVTDNRPHRIVVLLDTSGSMAGVVQGRQWGIALEIALHIARADLQNTSLALILFSSKVNEQVDFSRGNSAVLSRLTEIAADPSYARKNIRGETALYDAVASALVLLNDREFSNAISIISDGDDNKSRRKPADVLRQAITKGVRLNSTLILPEIGYRHRTAEELDSGRRVADMSVNSGGLVIGPFGGSRVNGAIYGMSKDEFDTVRSALAGLYLGITRNELVEIELPEPNVKWEQWSLEFSRDKKKLNKDYRIAYPKQLEPCSANSK